MRKVLKIFALAGLFVYGVLMLWLLFGQRLGYVTNGSYIERLAENINLIPFKTVSAYASDLTNAESSAALRHAVINLFGNVIMFVPLGFLLPCASKRVRAFPWHMLCSSLIIVSVEILQLFTLLGSCDIDDLILNLVGTAAGYLIFKAVYCNFK